MSTAVIKFCFDLDNVIANTDAVMRDVIQEYTQGQVQLQYEDIVDFDYYKCTDLSGNAITAAQWAEIHNLFCEPRFLWQIKPISGCIENLQRIGKLGRLHIATSRLRKARRCTVEWLDHYNIPSHDLHFLPHREKHASLQSFTAAVEDDYEQAVAFASDGSTPCYILRHPWNKNRLARPGIKWVKDWSELTDELAELVR